MTRMNDYEPWWKSAAAGLWLVLFMAAAFGLAQLAARAVVHHEEPRHDASR